MMSLVWKSECNYILDFKAGVYLPNTQCRHPAFYVILVPLECIPIDLPILPTS